MSASSGTSLSWDQAEGLRSPALAGARDPRNWATVDLAHQHALMAGLVLKPEVPEEVQVAFDTARNLYLYAWHVYRFYPVAEAQALVTLEAGLREVMPYRLPPAYQRPKQERAMLFGLVNHAIDIGLIRNEGFSRWHRAAAQSARERATWARLEVMERLGLQELEIDPHEPVDVIPEDQGWDLLDVLRRSLSTRRNAHAHGEGGLTPSVYGTLELVCEILNQVFPVSDAKNGPRNSSGESESG